MTDHYDNLQRSSGKIFSIEGGKRYLNLLFKKNQDKDTWMMMDHLKASWIRVGHTCTLNKPPGSLETFYYMTGSCFRYHLPQGRIYIKVHLNRQQIHY